MDELMERKPVAGRRPVGWAGGPCTGGEKQSQAEGCIHGKGGPWGELCSLILAAAATEHVKHTPHQHTNTHRIPSWMSCHLNMAVQTPTQKFTPMCAQDTLQIHGQTDTTRTHIISHLPICALMHRDTHSSVLTLTAAHVQVDLHMHCPMSTNMCTDTNTWSQGMCMSHPHTLVCLWSLWGPCAWHRGRYSGKVCGSNGHPKFQR